MKGYLAGPMRNYPKFNFPAFFNAAEDLRRLGHQVSSPAEHDVSLGLDWENESEDGFDLGTSIMWDLQQIADGECIWLLPGWEKSRGARVEWELANLLDKAVIYL